MALSALPYSKRAKRPLGPPEMDASLVLSAFLCAVEATNHSECTNRCVLQK